MVKDSDIGMLLQRELAQRCEKNPLYSLRSFARFLAISPASLSRFISSGALPSPRVLGKIIDRLQIGSETGRQLQLKNAQTRVKDRMDAHLAATPGVFKKALAHLKGKRQTQETLLKDEILKTLADPVHFAILELTELKGFDANHNSVSTTLGISSASAKLALDRLVRFNLLRRTPEGRLAKTSHRVTTTHDVASSAIKSLHRQMIDRALRSVGEVPVEERDVSCMIFPIDSSLMHLYRNRIRRFRRSMTRSPQAGTKDRVYAVAIQMFPMSEAWHPKETNVARGKKSPGNYLIKQLKNNKGTR